MKCYYIEQMKLENKSIFKPIILAQTLLIVFLHSRYCIMLMLNYMLWLVAKRLCKVNQLLFF